jgi:hypothetical protein
MALAKSFGGEEQKKSDDRTSSISSDGDFRFPGRKPLTEGELEDIAQRREDKAKQEEEDQKADVYYNPDDMYNRLSLGGKRTKKQNHHRKRKTKSRRHRKIKTKSRRHK